MDNKKTTQDKETAEKVWFAIRVTYNRELKVKADLDARGITNFVPMQYRREERNGQMVKRLVPSVHNLIFINITPEDMVEYKKRTALPIRYIMNRETRKPITVPNREMENFIKVAGTYDEKLVYLSPDPGDFAQGERVRIIGGMFAGAEGVFVRVKGDRRVVINVPGVVAVATTFVHLSMIEKITDPEPKQLDNALDVRR
ncbi:MAG: UpxY family transcription antiterminator [Muribaculaceae bacterium]|nr:UpxY family transcription antiterminator [Muribaculaceae bacterium]